MHEQTYKIYRNFDLGRKTVRKKKLKHRDLLGHIGYIRENEVIS